MSRRNVIGAFLDAVMPLRCVFCGTLTHDGERHICSGCLGDLPWIEAPVSSAQPGLDFVVAPLAYEFPVDAAIKAFKFRRRLHYGPAFAQLLCHVSRELPDDIDAVLPVPLHWRRQWWRGFNQALEIAGPVARHLGVPLIGGVKRRRATRPQSGLSSRERRRNLQQAFQVRRGIAFGHILIVDDVITTGTTVRQLGGIINSAGVAKVSALAVARAGA